MTVATIALVSAALLLALGALAWGLRDRPIDRWHVYAAGAVELVVVAFDVVAFVRLGTGDHPHQLAVYIGYLIGMLLVLPVATLLALFERTRYGSYVLTLGAVVVPILVARVHQVHG